MAEDYLNDGYNAAETAQEVGVPVESIYAVKQAMKKRDERRAVLNGAPTPQKTDDETSSLRREIELLRLQAERDRIMADLEFEKEKRALDLEIKRAELEERRMELDGEDDFFDEEEPLENKLFSFFTELLHKKQAAETPSVPAYVPTPEQPPAQRIDVTKPLTRDQVRAELSKLSAAEIAQAKQAPASLLRKGLKSQYPGITKENVELVLAEVKAWS